MLSQHTLCICKDKYLILTVHFHKGKKSGNSRPCGRASTCWSGPGCSHVWPVRPLLKKPS